MLPNIMTIVMSEIMLIEIKDMKLIISRLIVGKNGEMIQNQTLLSFPVEHYLIIDKDKEMIFDSQSLIDVSQLVDKEKFSVFLL